MSKKGNGFIEVECFSFDSTFIRFDLEHHILDIIFESLHKRGVNMSLNMHRTQYGLLQHNKILQNVEV